MEWFYLIVAGLFEIGWPIGFKIAQNSTNKIYGISISIFCITCSGIFMYLAQRLIPMGTVYAVWTGIGAAGTFFVGVKFFGDLAIMVNYCGVALIVLGVCLLKV